MASIHEQICINRFKNMYVYRYQYISLFSNIFDINGEPSLNISDNVKSINITHPIPHSVQQLSKSSAEMWAFFREWDWIQILSEKAVTAATACTNKTKIVHNVNKQTKQRLIIISMLIILWRDLFIIHW